MVAYNPKNMISSLLNQSPYSIVYNGLYTIGSEETETPNLIIAERLLVVQVKSRVYFIENTLSPKAASPILGSEVMEEEQFSFMDLFNLQTLQKLMVPFAFLIVILYNFCWKNRSSGEDSQGPTPKTKQEAEALISKKINKVSRAMRNDDGEVEGVTQSEVTSCRISPITPLELFIFRA